jgi:hypothetical protein
MQKRKMLWKKPEKPGGEAAPQEEAKPVEAAKPAKPAVSFNKWEATNFGSDEANEKFRRLMVRTKRCGSLFLLKFFVF